MARERPIIFSGPMVRAILDGRKTQTRRVIRVADKRPEARVCRSENATAEEYLLCWRHHEVGDVLWVRETWATEKDYDYTRPSMLPRRYPPGDTARGMQAATIWYSDELGYVKQFPRGSETRGKLRSVLFMPRWACRLLLRVTAVRAQRVQEISEEDAIAEGIEHVPPGPCYWAGEMSGTGKVTYANPQYAFSRLWNSINAKRGFGWDANPWVWAYTFERMVG